MTRPVPVTLLQIDDDEASNYFHEVIISGIDQEISCTSVTSGPEGLQFLRTKIEEKFPQPDIILLDINMPGMNGWEFLEQYELLEDDQKARALFVLISIALIPDDQEKLNRFPSISGTISKPLDKESVLSALDQLK